VFPGSLHHRLIQRLPAARNSPAVQASRPSWEVQIYQ